ncbi:MAG: hypothetical protein RI973_1442 [Bacteroidota bacterium]|jgi:ribonuclease Z
MKFALTVLGISAAAPAFDRHPSAHVLQVDNRYFLIDCGEGTQMRLAQCNIPAHKINHIFISHLHGDHIFGLPGLLFSYALAGRTAPLHLYSPEGLEAMMRALLNPGGDLGYPLCFHCLDEKAGTLILEDNLLTVSTVPLHHRIPTLGFVFREKPRPRNVKPEAIETYGLDIPQIKAAKAGEDIALEEGRILPNEWLTLAPPPPRSFAYISDTAYHEAIVPHIRNASLLYHETTFCEDMAAQAALTLHSTARQAALIARMAGVGMLITGHYSSRYREHSPFVQEAQEVFENTVAGEEGKIYEVLAGEG